MNRRDLLKVVGMASLATVLPFKAIAKRLPIIYGTPKFNSLHVFNGDRLMRITDVSVMGFGVRSKISRVKIMRRFDGSRHWEMMIGFSMNQFGEVLRWVPPLDTQPVVRKSDLKFLLDENLHLTCCMESLDGRAQEVLISTSYEEQ